MISTREERHIQAYPFFILVGVFHLILLFIHSLERVKFGETEHGIQLKFISGQASSVPAIPQKIIPESFSQNVAPLLPKPKNVNEAKVEQIEQKKELVSTPVEQTFEAQEGVPTDDVMDIYNSKLRSLIEANQFYPQVARDLNQTGVVYVSFTVNSSGHIMNVKIVKSSGYKRLDEAAVQLIQSVSGKLPFPRELNLSSLELEMPINYDLY